MRLDKLSLSLIRAWHEFLNTALRPNLTSYQGESFVYLKELDQMPRKTPSPPSLLSVFELEKGVLMTPSSGRTVFTKRGCLNPETCKSGASSLFLPPMVEIVKSPRSLFVQTTREIQTLTFFPIVGKELLAPTPEIWIPMEISFATGSKSSTVPIPTGGTPSLPV